MKILFTEKKGNPTPGEQLQMYEDYRSRRREWYDKRIESEDPHSVMEERKKWETGFENFMEKMRSQEVIV